MKQGKVEMHEVLEVVNREMCHKCLRRNIKKKFRLWFLFQHINIRQIQFLDGY